MTIQTLANGLIIVVLVAWLGYKQLTWRPANVSRMWRMPAILAIVGVISLATMTTVSELTPVDIAVLSVEIVISLGIGVVMGRMAQFRPMSTASLARFTASEKSHGRDAGGVTLETRTSWWGLALWVVLMGMRVGMDVLAASFGSELAAATGVILIMVAANRAARVAVIASRLQRVSVAA
jgi:hypothetical protein